MHHQDKNKKNTTADTWAHNIESLVTLHTVQDFWGLFNNILPPSFLDAGCNYYLFKKGIKPMWEDRANVEGGKWTVMIPKNVKTSADQVLSYLWSAADTNRVETVGVRASVPALRPHPPSLPTSVVHPPALPPSVNSRPLHRPHRQSLLLCLPLP